MSGHTANPVYINGTKKIIIFGGFSGDSYINYLYEVDLDGFCWSQIDIRGKGEYPLPRCYHTAEYDKDNNVLVVYGGWNANISQQISDNFTGIWYFDLKSIYRNDKEFTWELMKLYNEKEPMNLDCRRGHSSVLTNERKMYIFGGIKGFNKFLNEMIEIDLQV